MQLTTVRLIKLIIGIVVFVSVIIGFYLIFKTKIFDLFSGLPEPGKIFLSLIK